MMESNYNGKSSNKHLKLMQDLFDNNVEELHKQYMIFRTRLYIFLYAMIIP